MVYKKINSSKMAIGCLGKHFGNCSYQLSCTSQKSNKKAVCTSIVYTDPSGNVAKYATSGGMRETIDQGARKCRKSHGEDCTNNAAYNCISCQKPICGKCYQGNFSLTLVNCTRCLTFSLLLGHQCSILVFLNTNGCILSHNCINFSFIRIFQGFCKCGGIKLRVCDVFLIALQFYFQFCGKTVMLYSVLSLSFQ